MKGTIGHRDRKNPRSREAYEKVKAERNTKRGKQTFDSKTKTWGRE